MITIPLMSDIYSNIAADLKNKLQLDDVQLKMVTDAFAKVEAAQFKLCYLLLIDIQNNMFPDTADTESNGGTLERQGRIYLKRNPFPASDGYYLAAVTGIAGSTIDTQVTFKSNDDSNSPGNLYILDNEYTLIGTDDVITLRALNAGEDFLLNNGDSLTATQPLLGVNQVVTITSVVTAPTDTEDTDVYRQNIENAIVLEPQGGAKTDYRIWAADAAGVQRVYPQLKDGDAGTVQVFVEATPNDSTDGKGTPSTALLNAVKAVLLFDPDESKPTNDRGRAPIQAAEFLECDAITPIPVDMQITSLQTSTDSIQASISSNMTSFLFGVRPYIAGCDLPRDKNDILTSVKAQSVVTDTIGPANTFLSFQLSVDGVVVNTYTFSGGNIPYLRNVTYA